MEGINLVEIDTKMLNLVYEIASKDPSIFNYWSNILGFYPTRRILKEKTVLDIDFEKQLFLGAWIHSELVGFTMGIRRPWKKGRKTQGWIKFIYIAPAFRKKGVGTLLLRELESRFQDLGVDVLIFGSSSPNYLVPGMPQDLEEEILFFKENGWKQLSERTNLEVKLSAIPLDPKVRDHLLEKNQGYEIMVASQEDKNDIKNFLTGEFSKSWFIEISAVFKKGAKGILSILKDKQTDDLVGFAAINCTNENWFGPMGVSERLRGRGLGSILLLHNLYHARKAGLERIVIPWADEGFYKRVIGAKIRQKFWKLEKEI